ncbi:MAG: AAA family ATPase [Candidatus Babeliales bacterium]
MRQIVIFLPFLFSMLSIDAMNRQHRRREENNRQGCTSRMTSLAGRLVGEVMRNAVQEIDFGALLTEDIFRKPLDELRGQLEITTRNATKKAMKEFDKQLDTTLKKINKDFFKEILIDNFRKVILYVSIGVACNICVWYGGRVLTSYITDLLKKPNIIIRSSRKTFLQKFKGLIFSEPKKEPITMIHPPQLNKRLSQLIEETKHIKTHIKKGRKGVIYPNMVLIGAPGTGKSMFAEKFAEESGLDYDFVSGSQLLESGAGIRALNDIFQRAEKSKKNSFIFIDEGDSFLLKRERLNPDSKNYRTINHFLALTGKPSNKYMIMTATNHPALDEAMHRRFSSVVVFPQADETQRFNVLKHYLKVILQNNENDNAFVTSVKEHIADSTLKEIAQKTEGYSNADMKTIINNIGTRTFTTKDGLLSSALVNEVVTEFIEGREALQQKPSKK